MDQAVLRHDAEQIAAPLNTLADELHTLADLASQLAEDDRDLRVSHIAWLLRSAVIHLDQAKEVTRQVLKHPQHIKRRHDSTAAEVEEWTGEGC